MWSLRGRLTLGVTVALAAVFAVAGVLVARNSDRVDRQVLDDRLIRTAELSRATAVGFVQDELPGDDKRLDDVLRASASSLQLTIGSTAALNAGRPPPGGATLPLGLHTVTRGGQHYRTYVERLKDQGLGGVARLEVASSLEPLERRQSRLRRTLLTTFAVSLLVAAALVWFVTGGVLRPLKRLREGTKQIATEEDLARPLEVTGPTEARALAEDFNAMLERLGTSAEERNRALDATRRFAADAGHELRTPLTAMQATLGVLARHPDLEASKRTAMAEEALADQRRLVALLDGLQALARGDAGPVALAEADLAEICDASAAAARARWPGVTFDVALPDDAVLLHGWEPGLRLLVDNLIENACRHGRRDGAVVRIVLTGRVLVVEDNGPGIPAAERERLFEPFARLEGTDRPGSGLGLALVAQQIRLHGAIIEIGDAPELGGASMTVRF